MEEACVRIVMAVTAGNTNRRGEVAVLAVRRAARDARSPASVSATSAAMDVPQFDGLLDPIVDDDRESCDMMLEALRRYGASVQCAIGDRGDRHATEVQTRSMVRAAALPQPRSRVLRRIGAPELGCGTSQPRPNGGEAWRLELGRKH